MKTMPLTVRRCPPELHQALKKSARSNHRSLNGETLAWLERQASTKPVSAKETAAILRRFQRSLSVGERKQMAESIESIRRKMANEHLH
jgi:plasmid stability protein